jgi:hypothetical protein
MDTRLDLTRPPWLNGPKDEAQGRDGGPLSRLKLLRGCAPGVLAVLKPGNNSQRLLQVVVVGIGPPGGQLPADGDGLLDGGQRLLPPPQVAQPERQVVQRTGQVGPERVRAGRGQLPVGVGGLLDGGQRLLPPPQVGQPDRRGTGSVIGWCSRPGT